MIKLKHKISAFMLAREAVQAHMTAKFGLRIRASASYRWARREAAKINYRRQHKLAQR